MLKKYVLGFAFSESKSTIVLIEKKRPKWQDGLLNGVGGKIDGEETGHQAMVREFEEETGVQTEEKDWKHFTTMVFDSDIMGGSAHVLCFVMVNDCMFDCYSKTDEIVKMFSIDDNIENGLPQLKNQTVITNLNFLIPMALHDDIINSQINIK